MFPDSTGRSSGPFRGRAQFLKYMGFRRFSTRLARWAVAASALAGAFLLSGCLWLDGPQSTFEPAGPVAREQLDLFYTTCWVTFVIFILVGTALAYAMIKFRARSEAE